MPDSNVRWLEIQHAPLPNFKLCQNSKNMKSKAYAVRNR